MLGPNQLIGSNNTVSLTATSSGNNVIVSWPTNLALVNLVGSSTLETNAEWTAVNGSMSLSCTNYSVTFPAGGEARFFRLQK